MTNLCDVCGKPATQSMLRDPFGKSDEMRFVCSDHGFRIRDPADVAAIEQLHAAVKTAQELAARRLMEVDRLKDALKRVRRVAAEGTTHTGMIASLGILVDRVLNPGNGPLPPDYTYRSDEPCERHRWKPGMWNVYYVRYDGQERPALSAETAEGAANALRQDAADLVRVIESEGASRDASSPCPSVHDHMWSGDGPEAYCLRCRTVRTGE